MIKIKGIIGVSGHKKVFLGFAPGGLLAKLSSADVLDEEIGSGYQRRFSSQHSSDFRKYIKKTGSTTTPLTFNLRPSYRKLWKIVQKQNGPILQILTDERPVLAQVDCQHRLGYLNDIDLHLPFMTYIGLNLKDEMKIFNIINSKAKGLNSSLLDYHDAQLASDLAIERPELYIALYLNENERSPWFKQLDLGGIRTTGVSRRASLRTIQKSVKKFLYQTKIINSLPPIEIGELLIRFWRCVAELIPDQWDNPRKSVVTKGIGVYALTAVAGQIVQELAEESLPISKDYFNCKLSDFIHEIDWSNNGTFKGLGGESGVSEAISIIVNTRNS
jgi:DNA sulfur modification protein DndB